MLTVDVLKYIWSHPGNRSRRLRAVGRSVGWQVEKRLTGHARDIRVFGDMILRCYPDSAAAGIMIYANGWYDYDDMHFVRNYLRPGDSVVDIGANIGVYTLLAASLVGERGRVVSFEPGHQAYARLRENVELNQLSQVELHAAAVGEASRMVRFSQNEDLVNRIVPEDEHGEDPGEGEVELVPCVTLDQELAGSSFELAKLDVEGAERLVFAGGRRMLQECNPPVWLLELKDRLQRRYGSSAVELAGLLRGSGFELGCYDADRNALSFPEQPWEGRENVLAIHRSAMDRVASRLSARPPTHAPSAIARAG